MNCPFEKELKEGTMVCDFFGFPPAPGVSQCPSNIFNRCQAGDEEAAIDKQAAK